MSRSKRENQSHNKDWWGKRPLAGLGVVSPGMKFWKRLLHKKERWLGKKVTNEGEQDGNNEDNR